ncbi:hypothetical protein KAM448_33550 [Aeromonas caviae]|jgi:hypothetical protein|uniref:Protein beta n=1 Tax=Aeromonas caviae TaxID=648 RepID=A0ABD0B5B4_AERCA|nr:beta family protein [Aeromonas caviae]MBL0543168.1 beta family protein [Aeromonas caviae]MDX7709838.1 beta family protein [Aeromonas caviae]BCR27082.1 hypothetical protein KAM376_00880 [Aeromonas caviae]GJA83133.1 hypothetical protein KAM355_36930 [Aeromonas caviae]GJA97980.1 hypothetical protein KAM359_13880 [Aeromonas caviae]
MKYYNFGYLPILALSPAEMAAIEELPGKDRDCMLPLFLLKGWGASSKLSNSIERIKKSIEGRRWIADIDEGFIDGKKDEDGNYPRPVFYEIEELLDADNNFQKWFEFVSSHENITPTLRYNDSCNEECIKNQANNLYGLGRGLVVRVFMKTIKPDVFNKIVVALRESFCKEILFLLDYGDIDRSTLVEVEENTLLISKLQSFFPGAIFSISSSSFPNSFSGSYRGEIPIYERQFYNKIVKALPDASFVYSDRGGARAEKNKGGGGTPPPRIDYPLKNDWRFVRKELNEEAGEERKTLYKEAALEVIKSDYWEPSLALWGTQMIELTSKGDDYGITNPNRATAVRINIHLYLQLHYHDLIEGLDTDEEWID